MACRCRCRCAVPTRPGRCRPQRAGELGPRLLRLVADIDIRQPKHHRRQHHRGQHRNDYRQPQIEQIEQRGQQRLAGTNPPPRTAPSPVEPGDRDPQQRQLPGRGAGPGRSREPLQRPHPEPLPDSSGHHRGPGQRRDGLAPGTAAAARRPGRDEPAPTATTTTPRPRPTRAPPASASCKPVVMTRPADGRSLR